MLITFDFDETLTEPVWNAKYGYFEPSSNPNYQAIASVRDYFEQGHEVKIVTTRWRPEEINDFVIQHQLPVTSVHCTKGKLKAEILKSLNSKLHFDDNEEEAQANSKQNIPTMIVSYYFEASEQQTMCKFTIFS